MPKKIPEPRPTRVSLKVGGLLGGFELSHAAEIEACRELANHPELIEAYTEGKLASLPCTQAHWASLCAVVGLDFNLFAGGKLKPSAVLATALERLEARKPCKAGYAVLCALRDSPHALGLEDIAAAVEPTIRSRSQVQKHVAELEREGLIERHGKRGGWQLSFLGKMAAGPVENRAQIRHSHLAFSFCLCAWRSTCTQNICSASSRRPSIRPCARALAMLRT